MAKLLKLGTRKSLLARAQSTWVAREIEKRSPEVQVELVGIETQGDLIQDRPLQTVEGKDFFVAEIDEALKRGEVDFTVHSLKDLSLDRPDFVQIAAIPAREEPRDVLIFNSSVLKRLERDEPVSIGSSVPRRIENIPPFLVRALPKRGKSDPKIVFIEIRGNVNTRLARIQDSTPKERAVDGVALALAGLIRLWQDSAGRAELSTLLKDKLVMVLPLRECPVAPGQGALAIECRRDDSKLLAILRKIHHSETEKAVTSERAILAEWGGGCHQRLGATSIRLAQMNTPVIWVKGRHPDGHAVDELRWTPPSLLETAAVRPWDGSFQRTDSETEHLKTDVFFGDTAAHPVESVFIAHSRALPSNWAKRMSSESNRYRVYTSGTASWYRLAQVGVWVEGCAEGWGFEDLKPILRIEVLQLPQFKKWKILTHEQALGGWADGGLGGENGAQVIATYRVAWNNLSNLASADVESLKTVTHIYWASGSQFDRFAGAVGNRMGVISNACGPGKTATYLRSRGIAPMIFPDVSEWHKWVGIKTEGKGL